MRRWKAGSTRSKPSWFTTPPMRPARRPSETCSPISKDTTTVSGSTPPSGTSPPNRQSFRPRNPVSTFSGEHHQSLLVRINKRIQLMPGHDQHHQLLQLHALDEPHVVVGIT